MTVSYQYKVSSSTSGGFTKLLFLWRGSLYQVLYRELLLFMVTFGVISALYRNVLTEPHKKTFEKVVRYCDTFISQLPLSFILGFYVTYVASRWWNQYLAIPWPDKAMHTITMYVEGNDEYGRMVRRSLMRYLILTLILVLRSISSSVKKRFPTLEHVVESGYMTMDEIEVFYSLPKVEFNTYWIPCTWFITLLKEAKKSKRIDNAEGVKLIMEEFNEFRSKCGLLWSYDWISIPLAYTQVVTIATYSFFIIGAVGRQYVDGAEKKSLQTEFDVYVPVFTIVEFLFFMGLLKVAEQLINPFGDDEEDFELNFLIDRHTKVSFLAVDYLAKINLPLAKDIYFDEFDVLIPYASACAQRKNRSHRGSVHNMPVPEDQQMMYLPEIIEESDPDENRSRRTSTCSSKSEGKFTTTKDKNIIDNFGVMRVAPNRTDSEAATVMKRVNNADFPKLANRKSVPARKISQPVVLVSMTRRSSVNSSLWKPFKRKSTAADENDVSDCGAATVDSQQTNVDMSGSDDVETGGHVNPTFAADKRDV